MGEQKFFFTSPNFMSNVTLKSGHTIQFCPTLEATFTRVIEKSFSFRLNVWSYCTSRTIENSLYVIWNTSYSYVAVMRTAFHHVYLPIYLVYYFYYGYFLLVRTINSYYGIQITHISSSSHIFKVYSAHTWFWWNTSMKIDLFWFILSFRLDQICD